MPGWGSWALWGLASYQQGYDPQAKQSTRFLGRGTVVTDTITDASQRLTNLQAGTDVAFEGTTVRFNYSHPRTIVLRIRANSTDTGALFRHGTAGNLELWNFNTAASIRFTVNNSTVLTYAVSGLDGTRDELVVAWASEANPDTTGAADAVRSWLYIWNVTNGTFDKVRFTHAAKSLQAGTSAYFGATDSAGTSSFAPGIIDAIVYENRMMSATEVAIDWVETRSEPATDVDVSAEDEGMPVDATTGLHDVGDFQGPAVVLAVDKTRRLIRRCLSPLYNKRFRTRPTWTDALLDATDNPKIKAAPDEKGYRMHLGWLQVAPVPDTCTHLWVRVHVISFSSSNAVPLGVRFYTFNKPPGALTLAGQGVAESFIPYHVTEEVTRLDLGNGEWDIEALVPISRGTAGIRRNKTYMCIALRVDPQGVSSDDADAEINVNACHAVPAFVSEQGGVPFAELAG